MPFKNKPVRGIVVEDCAKMPKSFFENMLKYATSIGMKGLGYLTMLEGMQFKGPIAKFLTEEKQKELVERLSLKRTTPCSSSAMRRRWLTSWRASSVPSLPSARALLTRTGLNSATSPIFPCTKRTRKGIWTLPTTPSPMPQGGMDALLNQDPLTIKAYQYDIVCNGVELSSGAVRNHRPDIMVKAFELAGYSKDEVEKRFGALYNAFQYGAPPHAGMAPGVDRMIMLLTEEESIREVIAFPMNASAQDLLLGAPGQVTEQQLREVHIKIR